MVVLVRVKFTFETFNFSNYRMFLSFLLEERGSELSVLSGFAAVCPPPDHRGQREPTDFLLTILRLYFPFWGHIPQYSQFCCNTHLKSQINSKAMATLVVCINGGFHISYLCIHL